MKYELNDNDLRILSNFLSRVQLSGSEVQAFNRIVNIFNGPVVEDQNIVK